MTARLVLHDGKVKAETTEGDLIPIDVEASEIAAVHALHIDRELRAYFEDGQKGGGEP